MCTRVLKMHYFKVRQEVKEYEGLPISQSLFTFFVFLSFFLFVSVKRIPLRSSFPTAHILAPVPFPHLSRGHGKNSN